MTAVISLLSAGDAQRLTQRIKLTASVVRDNLFKLRNLVDEAKNSNAWQVLGFKSWTAYLSDTLGDEPMRLGREERQELVGYLAGEGLSSTAIAPIIGVTDRRARQLVAEVGNDFRPEPDLEPLPPANPFTGEVIDADELGNDGMTDVERNAYAESYHQTVGNKTISEAEKAAYQTVKTMGLDGKEYTRPSAPSEPRRRSLVDDAFTANTRLWEAIERIRSIRNDDRYTRNKADILAALQPSADLALEVLNDLFEPQKEN
ncbi:hypothetical protein [Plantibacter sp. YIM 135249]|uniref:hypothetical protein n=1 Tax=Plantibacter sp. YIM 135249 TaxID=3423918 RepID=UPI003D33ECD9